MAAVGLAWGSAAFAVGPFMVFFASNSTRIEGPFNDSVLGGAVAAFRMHDVREVVISGHADRAGSAPHNLDLSRRRADAIRAEFIRRGYTGTLVVEAYGEDRPLVETDDDVAHRENRRVEIVMRCFHNPQSVASFPYMRCTQ